MTEPVVDLRARYEELVGFFGGKSVRNGRFGQYEVVIVHVPRRGTFMLSGVRIVQLADASGVDVGWPVRIVWKGFSPIKAQEGEEQKSMKVYEMFIAEGDPLSQGELPMVNP
ncbi:MAG TPA: hypothetical protein VMI75_32140 [Polyangiaceae bacterium]|nr:hypothetical protein [Polyangiaceae bacterium]